MCEQALAPHFRVPTVKIGYLADLLSENALGVPKIRHTIIDCHNLNTLPGTGCEVLRKARQTMERAAFEKLKASCAKREEGKDLLLCSRVSASYSKSDVHQSRFAYLNHLLPTVQVGSILLCRSVPRFAFRLCACPLLSVMTFDYLSYPFAPRFFAAHQSADWPTHKFACVEPRW